MREIIEHKDQTGTIRYAWSMESFNERTGNECKIFVKNYHQAIDFFPEVRKNG